MHTRCGGGNRDDYEWVFDWAEKHPLYAYNADDDFDCTYCDFYFKFPEKHAKELSEFAKENPQITPHEKWQILFESLKKD